MDLYWKTNGTTSRLLAGVFGIEIGYMRQAKKHWEGTLHIPVELPRRYADQATMRVLMARTAQDWFDRVATARPAVDNEFE